MIDNVARNITLMILGVTGTSLIIFSLFRAIEENDYIDLTEEYAKSEKIAYLQPKTRTNLLRYIETGNTDSLIIMGKHIDVMQKENEVVNTVKNQLVDLQNVVKKKDHARAIDIIININGMLEKKKFEILDSKPLIHQLDSLRKELYAEVESK